MSDFDPTDVRALEAADLSRKEKVERAIRQEVDDFKWLMSDKRGRRIMWGLLDRAGIYRTSFTGNSETYFREGARNLGLIYLGLLNEHCSHRYDEMLKEQQK